MALTGTGVRIACVPGMKLAGFVAALGLLGCATTGGRISIGVSAVTATAAVAQEFRFLGCEDDDQACRDHVRNTGLVILGISAAALITAIIFESRGPSRD